MVLKKQKIGDIRNSHNHHQMPVSPAKPFYIPSAYNQQRDLDSRLTKDQILVSGAKLLSQIGSGEGGRVYKARSECGRIIAVKIKPFCSKSRAKFLGVSGLEQLKSEALNEAVLHLKLNHCNIIRMLKVYISKYYIIMHMEYFHGDDLLSLLRSKSWYIDNHDAVEILTQLSSGLAYIHNNGIAHGDLHLGNVMVDENNRVKLIDFGCALSGDLFTSPKMKDINCVNSTKDVLFHRARYPNESIRYFLEL